VAVGVRDDAREGGADRLRHALVGAVVDVRSRFDGGWCAGFRIAEVLTGLDYSLRYRVRRMSDGQVLPVVFLAQDVSVTSGAARR